MIRIISPSGCETTPTIQASSSSATASPAATNDSTAAHFRTASSVCHDEPLRGESRADFVARWSAHGVMKSMCGWNLALQRPAPITAAVTHAIHSGTLAVWAPEH